MQREQWQRSPRCARRRGPARCHGLPGDGDFAGAVTRPPTRVDPVRLKLLIDRARHEVESGALPSCQIAVAHNGELLTHRTFGDATENTRYILQSAGRVIVASALWKLLSDGALRLDELVGDIVP